MAQILDHGYLKLVETWGRDSGIIEAARMSTDKGFLGWEPFQVHKCPECGYALILELVDTQIGCPNQNCTSVLVHDKGQSHAGDMRLLSYLYKNWHMTPFEMAGMTIEVQAPIFVFREWHRHRTQSYNELSARYTPIPDVNYMPTVERCLIVNGTNKQAGQVAGAAELTHENALHWLMELGDLYDHAEGVYQHGLKIGIPKEVARLPVPVGRYSRMRASANLRNWLAFLTLRMDSHAQWEIRQYANAVGDLVQEHFPRTWKLYVEGR